LLKRDFLVGGFIERRNKTTAGEIIPQFWVPLSSFDYSPVDDSFQVTLQSPAKVVKARVATAEHDVVVKNPPIVDRAILNGRVNQFW
jgi:hypothetical protein